MSRILTTFFYGDLARGEPKQIVGRVLWDGEYGPEGHCPFIHVAGLPTLYSADQEVVSLEDWRQRNSFADWEQRMHCAARSAACQRPEMGDGNSPECPCAPCRLAWGWDRLDRLEKRILFVGMISQGFDWKETT